MHPLQNKVLRIVAVSAGKEVQLKGIVLDVKGDTIVMSVKDEKDLSIRDRNTSGASGWNGENKRAFFRLPVAVDAMVGPSAPSMACQVANVSGNGICFRTVANFPLNSVVKLQVTFPKSDPFFFTCQVVRSKVFRDSQVEYGCKLCGMSQKEETRLVSAIFNMQRKKN